jgi:hypothetical protein
MVLFCVCFKREGRNKKETISNAPEGGRCWNIGSLQMIVTKNVLEKFIYLPSHRKETTTLVPSVSKFMIIFDPRNRSCETRGQAK